MHSTQEKDDHLSDNDFCANEMEGDQLRKAVTVDNAHSAEMELAHTTEVEFSETVTVNNAHATDMGDIQATVITDNAHSSSSEIKDGQLDEDTKNIFAENCQFDEAAIDNTIGCLSKDVESTINVSPSNNKVLCICIYR